MSRKLSREVARRRTLQWILAPVVVITIGLGWKFPLLGYTVPVVMITGLVGGLFRGRWVCGNVCPRGSLLDRVSVPNASPFVPLGHCAGRRKILIPRKTGTLKKLSSLCQVCYVALSRKNGDCHQFLRFQRFRYLPSAIVSSGKPDFPKNRDTQKINLFTPKVLYRTFPKKW